MLAPTTKPSPLSGKKGGSCSSVFGYPGGLQRLGPGGFARITRTGRALRRGGRANQPPNASAPKYATRSQLSIHSQEGRRILANKNLLSGFIPADDNHYKTVEAAARAGGLLKP